MTVHDVPGAFNVRDVGGLPAEGGVTRDGALFRSGHLAHLTPEGRERLGAFGIRRIVDLRDEQERRYDPSHIDGLDVETVCLPMFAGSAASFFDDDLSLDDLYRALIVGSASRLVDVVRAVSAVQPVLVHCTVGKDRTGLSVALVLAAAGVDEDAVVADYARTETLLPAARNENVLRFLRARYPHARHLEDLATRSPAPTLRAVFDDLRLRYGGAVEYLRAHGLGDDEIADLRRALIV
ncbi:tyrosine-protein phosphatase [Microbacterium sp. NPDC077663]|uniref:tyrosine-protein phosphatase n=1 Tax=Microbacterium sp. NPDC077663 TaxID=3364189 RepID=UPI0037C6806F